MMFNKKDEQLDKTESKQKNGPVFTCPMHPEIEQNHPGSCPKCGMTLVPGNPVESQTGNKEENHSRGYPIYPESEDIYKNFQKEEDINPEDTSNKKEPNSTNALRSYDMNDESIENELDIPGAELDNLQEDIGSEDEENNYYSIGGENHLDLEEDHG